MSEEARPPSSTIDDAIDDGIDDAMALEDNEKLHMMPDATVGWAGHIVLLEQHPTM